MGAVLACRRQLVEMLTAEQSRLHTAAPAIRSRIAAHLAGLEADLDDTNLDLARIISTDPPWRERDVQLRDIPGVGPALATTLLAELP